MPQIQINNQKTPYQPYTIPQLLFSCIQTLISRKIAGTFLEDVKHLYTFLKPPIIFLFF